MQKINRGQKMLESKKSQNEESQKNREVSRKIAKDWFDATIVRKKNPRDSDESKSSSPSPKQRPDTNENENQES